MYTLDGLWYNLCFFDITVVIAGIISIIIGACGLKNKNDKEATSFLVVGILCVLLSFPMLIKDIISISNKDFCTINATFEYFNRAHRQAPLTGEYKFSTNDSDEKEVLYLDAFTYRKYLGAGFKFIRGAEYEITYDRASHVIVGVSLISS